MLEGINGNDEQACKLVHILLLLCDILDFFYALCCLLNPTKMRYEDGVEADISSKLPIKV